ncbi:beta-lactamase family protein [Psychroserpens sp. SPM9]|uniref:beta-lactamase family protein n=1 Tax=Psychroserpens sp. SPM9 TaxID=2975598 RepID=UPI0021A43E24|nr:beta-lactamase family protein [Psychroserpens sp. SPM9]MDG5493103.1 serine hydrolase [Psychroserpens sp. SPM9]
MKSQICILSIIIGLSLALGCTEETPKKTISYLEVNSQRLNELNKAVEADTYGTIHSILILKDHTMVFEKYYNGWTQDSLHMLQSATKSVVATLMGIAIKEGFVKDVNQNVLPFFGDRPIEHIDAWKKELTIEDLLTQRHGFDWMEAPWNSPDNSWRKVLASEGDWYKMILDTPMKHQPGTVFNYSNAAPVLTSGIIQEASKMPIDSFANTYLFKPLGITNYRFWEGNGGPQHNGAALLFLRSRDMLKIGQLHLNNGVWNGQQLLPENWAKNAAGTAITKNIKDNRFYRFGYDYFWWNTPKATENNPKVASHIYAARGAGGQYIIVDPKENMVVVITAWDLQKANYIFEIFTKYIQTKTNLEPTIQPELFAEGILTNKVETSLTLMPDRKELYFAKKDSFYAGGQKSAIYKSKLVNKQWSQPEVASFSGEFSDSSPFATPDGNRIYFSSNRPISGTKPKKDRDIWFVEKQGDSWSEPQHLSVYNSEKSEYSPTLDKQGHLYFGSYRDGGLGSGDLWVSHLNNGSYQTPINLGNAINTKGGEWGSCIAPDGDYIIFEASGREENITHDGDLYISYYKNNQWTKAKHLGELNSGGSDLSPKIHQDKLYFASNRHKDFRVEMNNNNVELYTIDLASILQKE